MMKSLQLCTCIEIWLQGLRTIADNYSSEREEKSLIESLQMLLKKDWIEFLVSMDYDILE